MCTCFKVLVRGDKERWGVVWSIGRAVGWCVACFFVLLPSAWSQESDSYVFPLRPGKPNHRSAGFGELRDAHFHAGLDLRTGRQTGWNVHAVASGYVSRIKIQRLGYGRAVYVRHSNGYVSVYAHLEAFAPPIERWLLEQQYALQRSVIDLRPMPWQFAVAKGEIIGLSGNTGGSTGPHLHFELRNAAQQAIDPLRLIHFDEIKDKTPPVVEALAISTFGMSSRVNGQVGRFVLPVFSKRAGIYGLRKALNIQGCVGLELLARDGYNWGGKSGSGMTEVLVQLDAQTRFSQYIKEINFNTQHLIAQHLNYEVYLQEEKSFAKLYIDKGNSLPFYIRDAQQGILCFTPPYIPRRLDIHVWDSHDNQSTLSATINATKKIMPLRPSFDVTRPQGFFCQKNVLLVHKKSPNPIEGLVLALEKGAARRLAPAYRLSGHNIYLFDLGQGLPQTATWPNGTRLYFDLVAMLPANQATRLQRPNFDLVVDKDALFDTLYLRFYKKNVPSYYREVFDFDATKQPLKRKVRLVLKPKLGYPLQTKTSVYRIEKNEIVFIPTRWHNNQAEVWLDAWGSLVLKTDTTPPSLLRVVRPTKHQLPRFYISDDLSGIKHHEASLNNQWLLMDYHPRWGYLQMLAHPARPPKAGTIKLLLVDKQGNKRTYTYAFNP